MVEKLEGMRAGTIGFRASGKVSGEDYREVLEPALRAAADAGEVRLLFVFEKDAELSPGALVEDARTGLALGIGQHSAWKRTALVTELDWVRRAFDLFSWLAPGEVKIFEPAQLEEARAWVSG
jgi:hypothetical protein